MRKLLIPAAALLFLAADSPQAIVKYRETNMKAMGAHMSAMSLVVKSEVSSRADLKAHAEAVHAISRTLPALFPASTAPAKVKTDAKAEVWKNPAAFKKAAAGLERESAKLADLAKKNDGEAFDQQYRVVAETCNDCHEQFRTEH